jgi:hypothetical protein
MRFQDDAARHALRIMLPDGNWYTVTQVVEVAGGQMTFWSTTNPADPESNNSIFYQVEIARIQALEMPFEG